MLLAKFVIAVFAFTFAMLPCEGNSFAFVMEEMMDEARRDILDNRVSAYAAAEQLVAKALGTE